MKQSAYIITNTKELRDWLKSIGLTPTTYPDCDRPGLIAPYSNSLGEMTMYSDGLRYETDDDYDEFEICETESEFMDMVKEIMGL